MTEDSDSNNNNKERYLRRHFLAFAIIASLNHALAYVVTSFASSLLPPTLASIILGLTWILNAVSGLLVSSFVTNYLGYKYAMILSMSGYTIQIFSLYLSVRIPAIAWSCAIVGSAISGITSAIWWTAQGVCFERTCQLIHACTRNNSSSNNRFNLRPHKGDDNDDNNDVQNPLELSINTKEKLAALGNQVDPITASAHLNRVRADLSARWTIIYQVSDIVVFVSLTIFPVLLGVSLRDALLALTALGVGTCVFGFSMFDSLGDHGVFQQQQQQQQESRSSSTGGSSLSSLSQSRHQSVNSTTTATTTRTTAASTMSMHDSILAVPLQFARDSRSVLLAPFVFGFGITTAMFSYFLNATVVDKSVGVLYLGCVEAFSYFIAALAAFPYAYICNHFEPQGSHFIMQFGSLMFMLTGLLAYLLTQQQLETWFVLLFMRGLYGLGRGVFEGACRAVYAQLFRDQELSTAFSAQTLLAGFSGGICFLLYNSLNRFDIAAITMANGAIALLFYSVLVGQPDFHHPIPWSALSWKLSCAFFLSTTTRKGKGKKMPVSLSTEDMLMRSPLIDDDDDYDNNNNNNNEEEEEVSFRP